MNSIHIMTDKEKNILAMASYMAQRKNKLSFKKIAKYLNDQNITRSYDGAIYDEQLVSNSIRSKSFHDENISIAINEFSRSIGDLQ